jgi:hypothetical protein
MARPIFKLSFGGKRGRWNNTNLNISLENEKSYPKKEQYLHPFFFLEIIFKIFNNGLWSKTHIFNILF